MCLDNHLFGKFWYEFKYNVARNYILLSPFLWLKVNSGCRGTSTSSTEQVHQVHASTEIFRKQETTTSNCVSLSEFEKQRIFNGHLKIINIWIFWLTDERLIICKNSDNTHERIMVPRLLCYHGWNLLLGRDNTTSTKTASWIYIILNKWFFFIMY